eukprot:COSAG02_NODE_6858_length_3324_cov_1.822016_2_plen_85_part_00
MVMEQTAYQMNAHEARVCLHIVHIEIAVLLRVWIGQKATGAIPTYNVAPCDIANVRTRHLHAGLHAERHATLPPRSSETAELWS